MMQAENLVGEIAGGRFTLDSTATALSAYARAHLGVSLASITGPDDGAPIAVRSRVNWHDGQPPTRRTAKLDSMDRVDRDLYVDAARGAMCWYRVDDLRDLFLDFHWDSGTLQVQGDFYFRLGNSSWSDQLRRWRQTRHLPSLRQRRFPTLLSYLVYYPCWWWLEQMHDFHPIHAAGVETGNGVILLAGASGVGKSTLATALATTTGAKLLGDSFVLHNGASVRAVHEPILLDDWSRGWLGARALELEALSQTYMLQRGGYQLPPSRLAASGQAGLLLFPRRAPRAYVRAIDPVLAHQRLSAADLVINDLRRYFAFAAALEHLVPHGLVARREAHLAQLATALPAYEVGLTADQSCDHSVAQILDLWSARSRPAGVA